MWPDLSPNALNFGNTGMSRFGYSGAPSGLYSPAQPLLGAPTASTNPLGSFDSPVGNSGNGWSNFSQGLGTALGGLQTLGNLWGGIQSVKLARDQFNFQKDFANTNLNNSIKDYNSALEGRMQARAAMETGDANAYAGRIAERQLTR